MTAHKPGQLNTGTAGASNTSPVPQATPPPGRYEIDTTRSAVTFRTRHMFGLAPVRGSFAIRAGTVDVAGPLTDPGIYAEIEAASFRTGNGQRDSNVRSARLLDAGQHPVITFRSERMDGQALTGTLTVRDVTRPVSLSIEQSAVSPGSFTARAATRIDRTVFGVTAYRGLAGRYLDMTVEVRCVRT
jgi:polyisoprenoid-binding protein YceI